MHISDEEMRRRMVFEQTDIIDRLFDQLRALRENPAAVDRGVGFPDKVIPIPELANETGQYFTFPPSPHIRNEICKNPFFFSGNLVFPL